MSRGVEVRGDLLAVAIAAIACIHCADDATDQRLPTAPGDDMPTHTFATLDVGDWRIGASASGTFTLDPASGRAAAEFPAGAGTHVMSGAGLWLSAIVDGEVRSTIAHTATEYGAGRLGHAPDTEAGRLFKVTDGDRPNALDVAEWPVAAGAPVDGDHRPALPVGGQIIWGVYNDGDAAEHRTLFGRGLGAEVRRSILGFAGDQPLDRTAVVRFEIVNRSARVWHDLHVGLAVNAALGADDDDLCGSDARRRVGYVYNGADADADYAMLPPAAGITILSVHRNGGRLDAPLSFNVWMHDEDPITQTEARHLLSGRTRSGEPNPERFLFSGDPTAGRGPVDPTPGDKRMLMAAGPFDVQPGDTLEVETLLLVSRSVGSVPRLASVAGLLADYDLAVLRLFDRGVIGAMPVR